MPAKQNKHFEKLKADGHRKITVWLSPEALVTVEELKTRYGSLNKGLAAIKGVHK
jgi:hypothetical protein